MEDLSCNVADVALVLEGGGMRAAHTAGIVATLIEHEVWFPYVCGVSAGSSNAVNYLSRDLLRTRRSFVEIAGDQRFGGIRSLARHSGFFNADFLYERAIQDGTLPFDWETFCANPASLRIQAFERDTGRTVSWTKADMTTPLEMVSHVRAGSTMPFIMKPIEIGGQVMLDGGLGKGAGIPLHLAEHDGYQRFFCIATRPAGYRKKPMGRGHRGLMQRVCAGQPKVFEALATRAERYNAALDHLDELERAGKALVVRPEQMPIHNTETNVVRLAQAFEMGHTLAEREMDRWLDWLRG
ncbi:patatin family protein [uncultured Parolsenella sp.]|uniref:patatin-like phospholipase family protein n=1 Tax=uncultured Parolsenella sp. TaxID=2083008 RepID=UPI0027DD9578|nr:patatin family protein [uncultured Parolsenella sp.]